MTISGVTTPQHDRSSGKSLPERDAALRLEPRIRPVAPGPAAGVRQDQARRRFSSKAVGLLLIGVLAIGLGGLGAMLADGGGRAAKPELARIARQERTRNATTQPQAPGTAGIAVAPSMDAAHQPSPVPPMSLQATALHADPRLPAAAPLKITIHYSSENAAAYRRAVELARGLSGQGLDVASPVASPERIVANTVGYFYAEDRPGAEIAARGLGPAWSPVQRHFTAREPLPAPGAIDLAVAGP